VASDKPPPPPKPKTRGRLMSAATRALEAYGCSWGPLGGRGWEGALGGVWGWCLLLDSAKSGRASSAHSIVQRFPGRILQVPSNRSSCVG